MQANLQDTAPSLTLVIPCYNEEQRLDRAALLAMVDGRAGLSLLLVEQNAAMALRYSDYAYVLDRGYRIAHHTSADTLDMAHEPDLIQGAQVMAVTALRLANREEMLPRKK